MADNKTLFKPLNKELDRLRKEVKSYKNQLHYIVNVVLPRHDDALDMQDSNTKHAFALLKQCRAERDLYKQKLSKYEEDTRNDRI